MRLMFDSIILDLNPYFGYIATFISLAMLLDVYILLSPQEKEEHSSSLGNRCTHLAAYSPKKIKTNVCHYISMPR